MNETIITIVGNLTAPGHASNFGRNYGKLKTALKERANAPQGLTHSLDSGKEGLAMDATRIYFVGDSRTSVRSELFWAKVDRSGGPDACWPFMGAINEHGYGVFNSGGGSRKAHRYAYMVQNGREATGDVDHACHNGSGCVQVNDCPHRRCCNPRHLEDVTRRENRNRGNSRNVIGTQAQRTHCPKGHEYTPENTWRDKHGYRFCRSCARENQACMRARRREEGRP